MKQSIFSSLLVLSLLIPVLPVSTVHSATVGAAAFAHAKEGELLVRHVGEEEAVLYTYGSNEEAAQAYQQFLRDPEVSLVQPNYLYEIAALPDDPLLTSQEYLPAINIDQAWNIQSEAKDVVIAVIDSGVNISHPDLINNIWVNSKEIVNGKDDDGNGYIDDIHGWDFLQEVPDPTPKFPKGFPENAIGVQHGTVVSGIIAAQGNNHLGISGVTWKAQLMPLRVLNEVGSGTSEIVTRALRYAIDKKVDIINLSLVGTDYDQAVVELLGEAYEQGILVVAAAGNSGTNLNVLPTYPVCYNNFGKATIIGVGSIELDDKRSSFSNYGSNCVDIAAPGSDVFSTRNVQPEFKSQEEYKALFSGTSFSAPQVTGVLALLKAVKPSLHADEALELLQDGAKSIKALHASGIGFDFALNAGGSLAMAEPSREEQGIGQDEPSSGLNGFLAYPRGAFEGLPYIYEFPGPTATTPVLFDSVEFHQGIELVKDSGTAALLYGNGQDEKKVYRYDFFSHQIDLLLDLSGQEQTVGAVAIGNVDGDPEKELIVASGPGHRPLVTIYTQTGAKKYEFVPYAADIVGGLSLALIDTNQDGVLEMALVPKRQTDGLVKIFEYTGLMHAQFETYEHFNGGATISVADVNEDGKQELILGPGEKGGPHVKVFSPAGALMQEFFAGDVIDGGGADIVFVDLDRDGTKEYVISYKTTHTPVFRIYSLAGEFQQEWGVLDGGYRGGVGFYAL